MLPFKKKPLSLIASLCAIAFLFCYFLIRSSETTLTTDAPSESQPSEASTAVTVCSCSSLPQSQDTACFHPQEISLVAEIKPTVNEVKAGFSPFRHWLSQYQSADTSQKNALLEKGIQLAQQRKEVMKRVIRLDPQNALENSVSLADYHKLPKAIQALVEEPYSAIGDYHLLPSCVGAGVHLRNLVIEGSPESLNVYTYGERAQYLSKEKIPVNGIRLGSHTALREQTFQHLQGEDIQIAQSIYPEKNSKTCFSTGAPLGHESIVALAGGTLFHFANSAVLESFQSEISALDSNNISQLNSNLIFNEETLLTDGSFSTDKAQSLAMSSAVDKALRPINVLCILTETADPIGGNLTHTRTEYLESYTGTTADALSRYSYGKTTINSVSVTSKIYNLGKLAEAYEDNYFTLHSEARNLYNSDSEREFLSASTSNYDVIVVIHPRFTNIPGFPYESDYTWAGLGNIGGAYQWIQDYASPDTNTHELGHNYGLSHSNSWDPGESVNPIDPNGSYVEYGDLFDRMGSGRLDSGHFNIAWKAKLGWIETDQWTEVAESGTYRVDYFDRADAEGNLALRLHNEGTPYYWVGYRAFSASPFLENGAYVLWSPNPTAPPPFSGYLLDMTPGSSSGLMDSALALGKTHADTNSEIYITPIAKGEESDPWIDVVINYGPYPSNTAPTATQQGVSNGSTRTIYQFSVTATDANGDALAYSWDFGDGLAYPNSPTVSKSWFHSGTYTPTVTISDMKGGSSIYTFNVTINDQSNSVWYENWTERYDASYLHDIAASEDVVIAVGSSVYKRSLDGTIWNSASFGGQYMYGIIWTGERFIAVGRNPSPSSHPCIKTSVDGNTWTTVSEVGNQYSLRRVASSGSVHIAVGDDGCILRSSHTDASSWVEIGSGTTYDLVDVTYGNGTFIAVGRLDRNSTNWQQAGNGIVLTSKDQGLTWSETPYEDMDLWIYNRNDFRTVQYVDDGLFLASGPEFSFISSSTDQGATWNNDSSYSKYYAEILAGDQAIIADMTGIIRIPGLIFAVGTHHVALEGSGTRSWETRDGFSVSSDGENWILLDAPQTSGALTGVAFFNNTMLTINSYGKISQSATIYTEYEQWSLEYQSVFGVDPSTDIDGDGFSSFYEYALGGDPKDASSTPPLPSIDIEDSSSQISITRNAKRNDVNYTVQRSPDLVSWFEDNLTITNDQDSSLEVRYDVPVTSEDNQTQFFRIHLENQTE